MAQEKLERELHCALLAKQRENIWELQSSIRLRSERRSGALRRLLKSLLRCHFEKRSDEESLFPVAFKMGEIRRFARNDNPQYFSNSASVPLGGGANEMDLDGLLVLIDVVVFAERLPSGRDNLYEDFALGNFRRARHALLVGL